MTKRKRLINLHDCASSVVLFEIKRYEYIDRDGDAFKFVSIKCEHCEESAGGATLKEAIKEWNAAHPLPAQKAAR